MTSLWNPSIFESITTLLDEHNIPYTYVQHEPTLTSADSAKARWEDLKIWGKALLIKVKNAVQYQCSLSNLFFVSKALPDLTSIYMV